MAAPRRAIVWSSDARVDLAEIWTYYSRVAGRAQADAIIRSRVRDDQVAEIVRVLHSRRDIKRIFAAMPGHDSC